MNRKDKRNVLFKKIANFTGKLLQIVRMQNLRVPFKYVSDHLSVTFELA